MSNAKACLRCGRAIDQWAGICPFCNWDQRETPQSAAEGAPSPAMRYVPPEDGGLKRKVAFLAAGAMLLVASFGVGMVINQDGAPKRAPETLEAQAAEHNTQNVPKPMRADTPLVPAGAGGIEQPITSAPAIESGANGASSEYDRTDATAVSAAEYSEMAKRAKAENEKTAQIVDPRSITGPAYAQAPRPRRTAPVTDGAARTANASADAPVSRAARRAVRTRPVAEYQPLPSIRARGSAKLTLLIGPQGEVRQVSIEKPLENGNTAALISAVQRWRFKPATENGEPVAAPYSVEIRFQ
jgi:TonB family protein